MREQRVVQHARPRACGEAGSGSQPGSSWVRAAAAGDVAGCMVDDTGRARGLRRGRPTGPTLPAHPATHPWTWRPAAPPSGPPTGPARRPAGRGCPRSCLRHTSGQYGWAWTVGRGLLAGRVPAGILAPALEAAALEQPLQQAHPVHAPPPPPTPRSPRAASSWWDRSVRVEGQEWGRVHPSWERARRIGIRNFKAPPRLRRPHLSSISLNSFSTAAREPRGTLVAMPRLSSSAAAGARPARAVAAAGASPPPAAAAEASMPAAVCLPLSGLPAHALGVAGRPEGRGAGGPSARHEREEPLTAARWCRQSRSLRGRRQE